MDVELSRPVWCGRTPGHGGPGCTVVRLCKQLKHLCLTGALWGLSDSRRWSPSAALLWQVQHCKLLRLDGDATVGGGQ
jgi:hypothetical protein